ncbi:MAG: hypothetical protein ACPGJS_10990 [Flammeovirgaceae bacterium]
MIKTLSKKRILKPIAVFLAVNLLLEVLVPTVTYALTNGPSQPEIQSFEPIGTSEMVNLFTGDFTYNIPLFELPGPNGGYPFNLAYHSGIGMDQEASWVGLGWNLQPGSMTRSMTGMPDEFNGDEVLKKMDMKASNTIGVRGEIGVELFGWTRDKQGKIDDYDPNAPITLTPSISLGIYNNSFRGLSTEFGIGANLAAEVAKFNLGDSHTIGLTGSFNAQLTLNSQDGVDVSAGASASTNFSFLKETEEKKRTTTVRLSNDIGFNYNHKQGLESITTGLGSGSVNYQIHEKVKKKNEKGKTEESWELTSYGNPGNFSAVSTVTLAQANPGYTPQVSMPFRSNSFAADAKLGGAYGGVYINGSAGISFSTQKLDRANQWTPVPAYGYLNLQGANNQSNCLLDFNREKDGIVRDEATNLWMPRLTYDAYSVTGHGMAGAFRPYRRDIGVVWDQTISSSTDGYTAGGELAFPGPRFGVNYGTISGYSQTKKMDFIDNYKFQKNEGNNQMIYFKAHGEPTTKPITAWNNVDGYKPKRFQKNVGAKRNFQFNNTLEGNEVGSQIGMADREKLVLTEKERRNSLVLPITNKDLLKTDLNGDLTNESVLREFQVEYYDHTTGDVNDFTTTLKAYDRKPTTVNDISDANDIDADLSTGWTANHMKINKSNHMAGFLNVDPAGLRYVYGLPVYNTEQVDANFSVAQQAAADVIDMDLDDPTTPAVVENDVLNYKIDGTDEFYSKTKLPPYAYAYMLTSILGVDYVDADGIPGPSDGDLGYWVKFNYRKVADDYQWRAPFTGAKYNPGYHNTTQDDRASYTYGKKEVWYLATAETATHKAFFHIEKRHDAYGAAKELQNFAMSKRDKSSYRLAKIALFSKLDDAKPIKEVVMTYDYSLCKGVENNDGDNSDSDNEGGGKLTLKQLYFKYRGNEMGSRTPYQFEYGNVVKSGTTVNPDYHPYNVDRWGNYRRLADIPALASATDAQKWQFQLDYPYVHQDTEREKLDEYTYAWELTGITLPSGSKIQVEYEADDYAYVQNKQAMYMTDIVAVSGKSVTYGTDQSGPIDFDTSVGASVHSKRNAMTLYSKENWADKKQERTRIYFRLKKPVAAQSSDVANQYQEIMKYVDQVSWQLYFKANVYLQKSTNESYKEFVAGYADIKRFTNSSADIGHHSGAKVGLVGDDGNGNYTHGFITVEKTAKKKKWHPISVAAWQHIQVNQPELYTSAPNIPNLTESDKNKIKAALGLITYGEMVSQMFRGFYAWAGKRKQWGRRMEAGKSWIRLNVPDKVKVGGGSRVKKVSLTDKWNYTGLQSKEATYGQVYEYTTTDEDGTTYSSGVAAYEPLMGGDEISVRTARKFSTGVPLRNDNDFFFEFPINESFYPGPSVGYSKVTVKSLASADAKNYKADGLTAIGFHSTTGATVHEFYTAKDFPVITDETDKNDKMSKPKTKNRIVYKETFQNSIATQGYTVIQNNMHGQQKKISNYGMDQQGNVNAEPISWVSYTFRTDPAEAHGIPALKLKNKVIALMEDADGKGAPLLEERIIGEEMDFFVDARETYVFSQTVGQELNIDLAAAPPIPINSMFPKTQVNEVNTKSIVTNKVISRIGILDKVEAWNQGALVQTFNEIWDGQTGEVVVSSVNNNFNDKIYTYNIPAHLKYEGLGPAYENIGMTTGGLAFDRLIAKKDTYEADGINHEYKENYYVVSPDAIAAAKVSTDDFHPGDEFIVRDVSLDGNGEEVIGEPLTKMVYVGLEKGDLAFYSTGELSIFMEGAQKNQVSLFLYRSGKRNLLSASVGSITAKVNPLMEHDPDGLDLLPNNYKARSRDLQNQNLPAIVTPDCPLDNCLDRDGVDGGQ